MTHPEPRFTEAERAKLQAAGLDPDEIVDALDRPLEPKGQLSVVIASDLAEPDTRRLWARVDADGTPWRSERAGEHGDGDYSFAAWDDLREIVIVFTTADLSREYRP